MKKKLSVGIASLAVLAMAGSAYAADVPGSSNASNTVKVSTAQAAVATEAVTGGQGKQQILAKNIFGDGSEIAVSAISFDEIAKEKAKEKGITVEELIAQLKREVKTSQVDK
ncbi:hypothetical protein M5W83_05950 [Paenibacillus thiaminolyticus]|uniref:Uncharacterized protein n=1 Tax=Paenibacillus thiaminolyticus TaxID=49283 RepID=A0AAP9DTG3_PANTH|nr:hypothetical protein [Paenibacillus thiaminolyticus]MCY9536937.1 hypothetical protein [Paenibacillus thiaminolyticus]MCY9603687.1 hypothetical protein [Paenibacillus thiaminolyticus]MCY9606701.1 hypothetical protein [Paenibacillus thiaminolyticus]MCY9612779.1 hypothetical protein [Paenibacillus thiaminolyticus]MCY9619731.1 hypothetical protein [Paenibacillus thiaminolyticus]